MKGHRWASQEKIKEVSQGTQGLKHRFLVPEGVQARWEPNGVQARWGSWFTPIFTAWPAMKLGKLWTMLSKWDKVRKAAEDKLQHIQRWCEEPGTSPPGRFPDVRLQNVSQSILPCTAATRPGTLQQDLLSHCPAGVLLLSLCNKVQLFHYQHRPEVLGASAKGYRNQQTSDQVRHSISTTS